MCRTGPHEVGHHRGIQVGHDGIMNEQTLDRIRTAIADCGLDNLVAVSPENIVYAARASRARAAMRSAVTRYSFSIVSA